MFGANGFTLDMVFLESALLLSGFIFFVVLLPNTHEIFRRYNPALMVQKINEAYKSFNFSKLFTQYVGNPLIRRAFFPSLYSYSLASHSAIFLFGFSFYQFNIDKIILFLFSG